MSSRNLIQISALHQQPVVFQIVKTSKGECMSTEPVNSEIQPNAAAVATTVGVTPVLQRIALNKEDLTPGRLKALLASRNILSLDLSHCGLHDEDAAVIAEGLATNTTLRELNLMFNDISQEGVKSIAQALAENPDTRLAKLDLSYNSFSTRDPSYAMHNAIAHMLNENKRLTMLGLDGLDNWSTNIANSLKANTCLSELYLYAPTKSLDPFDFEFESELIGVLTKSRLKVLDLGRRILGLVYNYYSDGKHGQFADFIAHNPYIRTLGEIQDSNGGEGGEERLARLQKKLDYNNSLPARYYEAMKAFCDSTWFTGAHLLDPTKPKLLDPNTVQLLDPHLANEIFKLAALPELPSEIIHQMIKEMKKILLKPESASHAHSELESKEDTEIQSAAGVPLNASREGADLSEQKDEPPWFSQDVLSPLKATEQQEWRGAVREGNLGISHYLNKRKYGYDNPAIRGYTRWHTYKHKDFQEMCAFFTAEGLPHLLAYFTEGPGFLPGSDINWDNLLDLAIKNNQAAIFQYLLTNHRHKTRLSERDGVNSMLLSAAKTKNQEVVFLKTILELGADINTADEHRYTAWHHAVSSVPRLRYLYQSGINVHARNCNGNTALHLAMDAGKSRDDRKSIRNFLIGICGLNPEDKNHQGKQAMLSNWDSWYDDDPSFNSDSQRLFAEHEKDKAELYQRLQVKQLPSSFNPLLELVFIRKSIERNLKSVSASSALSAQQLQVKIAELPDTEELLARISRTPSHELQAALAKELLESAEEKGDCEGVLSNSEIRRALKQTSLNFDRRLIEIAEAFDKGKYSQLKTLFIQDPNLLKCVLPTTSNQRTVGAGFARETLGQYIGRQEKFSAFQQEHSPESRDGLFSRLANSLTQAASRLPTFQRNTWMEYFSNRAPESPLRESAAATQGGFFGEKRGEPRSSQSSTSQRNAPSTAAASESFGAGT